MRGQLRNRMYGAILGDIIGSPYEFDANAIKTKDFPLFNEKSEFTDDTVMTAAVANALLELDPQADDSEVRKALVRNMKDFGHRYPFAGYGMNFSMWLEQENEVPYDSYGNGSAMRVSPVAWLFSNNMQRMRRTAALTAMVTHNHPEGIKGAEACACAIFLAMHKKSVQEIRSYIESEFGYDLHRSVDDIRPGYHHVESCQETVPEAIICCLESSSFEDAVRNAVSLGGDSDTLAAIAGSIAEAMYGIPQELKDECRKRLPDDILSVLDRFEKRAQSVPDNWDGRMPKKLVMDPYSINRFHEGNESIEEAIRVYDTRRDRLSAGIVLEMLRFRMKQGGYFLIPVQMPKEAAGRAGRPVQLQIRTVQTSDGRIWQPVFTGAAAIKNGKPTPAAGASMESVLKKVLQTAKNGGISGVIINPWSKPFPIETGQLESFLRSAETSKVNAHLYFDIEEDPANTQAACLVKETSIRLIDHEGSDEEDRNVIFVKNDPRNPQKKTKPSKPSIIVRKPQFTGNKEQDAERISSVYTAVLDTAVKNGVSSVALQVLFADEKAFDKAFAGAGAVSSILNWITANPLQPLAVVLVVKDRAEFDLIQRMMQRQILKPDSGPDKK